MHLKSRLRISFNAHAPAPFSSRSGPTPVHGLRPRLETRLDYAADSGLLAGALAALVVLLILDVVSSGKEEGDKPKAD